MKKLYRNVIILVVAICFAVAGFVGADQTNAQTKKTAKPTPTAKKPTTNAKATPKAQNSSKATAKATPKPTPKTVSKSNSSTTSKNAKTSDKTKTATQNDKTKSATEKDKTSSTSKNAGNSNKTAANKTKSDAAAKSTSKTTSKTAPKTVPPPKTTTKSNSNEQVIVTATASRIRQQPTANAAQLMSVKIGKTLPVYEKNASWYRVEYEDGKSGWISRTTAREFDNDKRDEIYQEIADKYSGSKTLDFSTAIEVVDFLRTAHVLARKDALKAELAFKRLQILAAAMKAVPFGKSEQSPYKPFLKAHEKEVVYSEPSGEWYVRSDVFWELHSKFTALPIAEEIAWAAAQNPIPGECEGYVNCYLYLLRATHAEYLNFYPNGKYSKRALSNITNLLEPMVADLRAKTVYTPPSDISDRAEFNRFLTELRTIISKMPDVDKARTLQQINQLGEGYK